MEMESMYKISRRWAFYVRKVKEYMAYKGAPTTRRYLRYNRLLEYRVAMVKRSWYYMVAHNGQHPGIDSLTFKGEEMPRLTFEAGLTEPGNIPPEYCVHRRGFMGRCMDCGTFPPGIPSFYVEYWKENGEKHGWPKL